MFIERPVRVIVFAVVLVAIVAWTIASGTAQQAGDYPNADLLASAEWLEQRAGDEGLVIVDVRNDKHFDGNVIPGAIRMPWGQFQTDNPVERVGSVFVGVGRAQQLLGEHGIQRSDTVVLYDDVERDGGATASYIFWVLEYLGHENVHVLNGGIEAWQRAGFDTAEQPAEREPVTYQVAAEEIVRSRRIGGPQIYERLGDRYYQVLDVRSRDEYLGEVPSTGWEGKTLKAGHVPGAFNLNHENAWADSETKLLKSYDQLQRLYAGLDPTRAVVTYCYSGRRSSHTYFVLRLMGFSDVRVYDESWKGWGNKWLYYPAETKENVLQGAPVQGVSMQGVSMSRRHRMQPAAQPADAGQPSGGDGGGGQSSYISCGG